MAKTLFIVDDDVFQALPAAHQKKLVAEAKKLFSFIPQFTVVTRTPALFPATLHFTDSVVKLVESDDEVTSVSNGMRRQEDANVRFSIRQTGVHLRIDPLVLSPAGDPDRGGLGGHGKQTVVEGGGKTVSITITYGVASLESAGQAVVDHVLGGRTMEDILKDRRKAIAKKGLAFFGKHESLISMREESEIELVTKHTPLKDWPTDQADDVVLALARLVAHEARHQYVGEAHSARGLGADEPKIFGDKHFEQFDGTDKANILNAINLRNTDFNRAKIHLETCPKGQASPFA